MALTDAVGSTGEPWWEMVANLSGVPFVDSVGLHALKTMVVTDAGGRVITPPHRKFTKNAPDWYEEMYRRQRTAHFSRRIRVEHGASPT
ncbi:hypothetical protein [Streptomyces sp. KL2]|uniref:hypothetical protein n=1 Tax=Streptomyces sp. KL2 TaxID=3050126 RepID=UPI003979EC01